MLRYLPQVLKRARGLDPTDPLIRLLEDVLRRWPLSGVLSDVARARSRPLDFGGHPGLLLLYAERLAANDRPAWRPVQPSPGWDYYELVNYAAQSPGNRTGQMSPAVRQEKGLTLDDAVDRLRREVVEPLKRRFVDRDEIVDLIALAVTAGEHLLLHGPPGTAKSALIRQFASARARELLRIPADPVLRAERGLRADRPGRGSARGPWPR